MATAEQRAVVRPRRPGAPSRQFPGRALDGLRCSANIRPSSALEAPAHRERTPVMMMQHDTGPMPPNALAQETVDAVHRALERHGREVAAEPAPEVRAALHALAREARL